MKPLVILLLGCLPLAVVTANSFVELGSIDEQLGRADPAWSPDQLPDPPERAAAERAREARVAADLGRTDLFADAVPAVLEDLPKESRFHGLEESWGRWEASREMVAEFARLERERSPCSADAIARTPLEDVEAARRTLSELKADCEASRARYEALKERFGDSPARGAERFLTLVDERVGELERRIEACDRRAEAASLLADARAAFRPSGYGECVSLCDRLLAEYASALGASAAEKVHVLRRRAQFRADAEHLFSQLDGAPLDRRQALLESFLGKYADRPRATDSERQVCETCAERLRDVQARLEAEAAERAARALIQDLHRDLPTAFDDRLRGTVRIVDRYPSDSVKIALRGNAKQWLAEFLPEKQIAEPPGLEEAETTRHEILRGYFVPHVGPDGTLLGYKRYPTLEARNDPGFTVGTYRKEEFLVPPGDSVPKRCVERYNQARSRLIDDPSRRASWVELADLCRSLEAELRAYRAKEGAAREAPELSFADEERFARELLDGAAWADMETLFGP